MGSSREDGFEEISDADDYIIASCKENKRIRVFLKIFKLW